MRSANQFRRGFLGFCLFTPTAFLLQSCGVGSGNNFGGSDTGSVQLLIRWPERPAARLVPVASNSITITFKDAKDVVRSRSVFPKPALAGGPLTATIKNLPVGNLKMEAVLFPNSDGTGVAQAKGNTTVKIESQKETPVSISPDTTIVRASIDLGGDPPSIQKGDNLTLDGVCYDAANAIVPTDQVTGEWKSSDATVASVNQFGFVTGLKNGNTTITYTEKESKVSATLVITVSDRKIYKISGVGGGTFVVDDALDIYLNGTIVYTDGQNQSGTRNPVTFFAKKGDTLRFVLRDPYGFCYSLSPLEISDLKGNAQTVEPGINGGCGHGGGDKGIRLDHTTTIPF